MTDTELRAHEAAAEDAAPRQRMAIKALAAEVRAYRTSGRNRLTDADRAAIRARYTSPDKPSTHRLAREFGVSQNTVYYTLFGRTPRGRREPIMTDNMSITSP